jgi:ABC-type metal ion transport system substrate-binding protein
MNVILDIKENHSPFFMELLKSLDYINIVKEVHDKRKQKIIKDLAEAFNDVRLHEAGKKKLKTAKQILNEL